MCRHLSVLSALLFLLHAGPLQAKSTPKSSLKVKATLVVLPRSPACQDNITHVTSLYRVDRVLEGTLEDKTALVVHRCPRIPRGQPRYGKGNAPGLWKGQTHLLTLRPLEPRRIPKDLIDPFTDDDRPRYAALQTDLAPKLPYIVVVVSGGGGTSHRLVFNADQVSVGRAADVDVLLADPSVALRHLRLVFKDERIRILPLGADIQLNGKPLAEPRWITSRDRVQLGPYTLKVSLFLAKELERLRRELAKH